MGKKKQPFYRIVATDSRVARDGKYIEKIGHYNPLVHPPEVLINEEKALLWLNRGAIPSDTVRSLLSKKGVMLKWHLEKKGFAKEKIEEEIKKWEVLQIENQKREEALKLQKERELKQASVEEETVTDLKTEESEAVTDLKTEEPEAATDLKTEESEAATDLKTEESGAVTGESKEEEQQPTSKEDDKVT